MNGIFAPIYTLFGTILSWFYSITGTYALALLLYALAFKIIFLPFSIKQQKNQIAMAKLRPKMMKIEKKYAGRNDQATLRKKQEEMMELQRKEGYSPFSGCLPLLIQLPIIIILYNVIRTPLTYICKLGGDTISSIATTLGMDAADQIKLVDAIKSEISASSIEAASAKFGFDVATLPNFNLFGANLAATPSLTAFNVLLFIPFLAAGAQWLSMWLMRKFNGNQTVAGADDQAQMSLRMMDIMMPAMTLFFCFSFSGMLGIYWIYQSLLGILQQFILSKAMPLPKYTAEELKEMEKAEKEKAKAQKEIMKSQPKYKSLHYIDEEDYEELPEIKTTEAKETKTSGGLNVGSLKDDKKN